MSTQDFCLIMAGVFISPHYSSFLGHIFAMMFFMVAVYISTRGSE